MAQNINNAPAGADRDNTSSMLLVLLAIVVVIVAAVYLIPRIRSGMDTTPNDVNIQVDELPDTTPTPTPNEDTSGSGSTGN